MRSHGRVPPRVRKPGCLSNACECVRTCVLRVRTCALVCKWMRVCRFACRRANKTRSEALAYYNLGVLHDNDKEFDKANRCVCVCGMCVCLCVRVCVYVCAHLLACICIFMVGAFLWLHVHACMNLICRGVVTSSCVDIDIDI